MFRRKVVIGLIAGSLLAGAVVAAVAAEEGTRPGLKNTPLGRLISGCVGRMMVLRSELDLTSQQRDEVHKILKGHRQQIVQQAHALWEKRVALRETVLKSGAEEAEIRKAAGDLAQQIGDAAVLAAKLRAEIAPLLTPEQQKLIQKYFSDNEQAVEKFFAQASKVE
jgi:Spy/CpxP family protein refolding chaperone